MHRYQAYGLVVESEIELPELRPAPTDAGAADLRVRLGGVPERIDDPVETRVTWAARPGAWLHEIDGVARYYVHEAGREVCVEPTGGTPADVRSILFASPLGAVFHQRGWFVLHASAAALPGGAVAVAGHSGAGKSTTLAALAGRGHPVLSDDKTVVRFGDDGRAEVLSGYPTMRLWRDAVERVGEAPETLPALREGIEKYLYRPPAFREAPEALGLLVVLAKTSALAPAAVEVERLGTHEAVGAVLRQTYRRRIVDGSGLRAAHFAWATRVAAAVPVVRVTRSTHGESVEAVVDTIEGLLAEGVDRTPRAAA